MAEARKLAEDVELALPDAPPAPADKPDLSVVVELDVDAPKRRRKFTWKQKVEAGVEFLDWLSGPEGPKRQRSQKEKWWNRWASGHDDRPSYQAIQYSGGLAKLLAAAIELRAARDQGREGETQLELESLLDRLPRRRRRSSATPSITSTLAASTSPGSGSGTARSTPR